MFLQEILTLDTNAMVFNSFLISNIGKGFWRTKKQMTVTK